MPLTVDERIRRNQAAQDAEKQAQRTAVRRNQHTAQIQSTEHRFDGQIDKCRGEKRGAYHVGGLSKCTVQDKKRKVRQAAEAAGKSLDSARVIYQLEDIDLQARCSDGLTQTSLDSFFSAHTCMRKGDEVGRDEDEEDEEEEGGNEPVSAY